MAFRHPYSPAIQKKLAAELFGEEPASSTNELGLRVAGRKPGRRATSDVAARGFASRLKRVLAERGLALDTIAGRLGYDPSDRSHLRQIQRWTTAAKPSIPDPPLLMAICAEFRISADYLLFGIGGEGLDRSVPRGVLSEELAVALREELRAKDPSYPELIEKVLKRDGDLFRRLVDVYHLRVLLEAAGPVLGLSDTHISFASREIELRLVSKRQRKREPATKKAAEKYLRRKRSKSAKNARG